MSGMEYRGGLSGIVLAGGISRRMGRNKAELRMNGKTFLELQVDKFRSLGIVDVMLSGAGCPAMPGARVVPDEYMGKGPLGGIHACLRAARNPACLVLSVDVPLVPSETLAQLCRAHKGGVTVLRHGVLEEPLIGVYDRAVAVNITALLDSGKGAVRTLRETVPWSCFDYLGPEELLINCNTPEEAAFVKRFVGGIKRKEDAN